MIRFLKLIKVLYRKLKKIAVIYVTDKKTSLIELERSLLKNFKDSV